MTKQLFRNVLLQVIIKKRTLTKIQVISPFLKKQPFKEDVWL